MTNLSAFRQDSGVVHSHGLELVRLNGNIGAEIRGADLKAGLTPEQYAFVRDAFVRYEVLIFRNQDITLDEQMAFGRLFGSLSIHPFSPNLDDRREVIVLDYSADNPPALTDEWHSDETFRECPPLATILRSKIVPAYGGDTLFSSMTAAYAGLSERMKQYIHGMVARHDFKPFRRLFTQSDEHWAKLREIERQFPNPWHPVVRVHPETGRRSIFVNPQFTVEIKGLPPEESNMLLQFLYSQAWIPEYQLRVKWEPDMVVMWDNRSVQHYAVHDYYPQRRTMERITVAGEPVIGVEGPYTPEEGVALPSGHDVRPQRKAGPVREFERHRGRIAS